MLPIHKCLPVLLAAITLFVAGCRGSHNNFRVELTPRGNIIERKLVFYHVDPAKEKRTIHLNTNGLATIEKKIADAMMKIATNMQAFDSAELAAITALYPTNTLTNVGNHYIIHGAFSNELPNDVGGAGAYNHLTNSLGEAGFYMERFRGNDDLVVLSERRIKAADQLTDIIIGWSQTELGREPDYNKLRQFLNVDFRHDLKNLGAYWWEGQLASDYKKNAAEEFAVRSGQYLLERGYFTTKDIPGWFKWGMASLFIDVSGNAPQTLLQRIQRPLAHTMGVPETEAMPALLVCFADETRMEKSFGEYLAGTDLYRAKLMRWEQDKKLNRNANKPEPLDVWVDAVKSFNLFNAPFGNTHDLAVRLSLESPPVHSNGRWDNSLKQVVWDTRIEDRTCAAHLPVCCYASWSKASEVFQKEHLGKVALTGDDLIEYCLWRSGLSIQRGNEWEAFLLGLKPGTELIKKLNDFRFSGESVQEKTGNYPRELLKMALQ